MQILLIAGFPIKWSKVKGPTQEIQFLGIKWQDACCQIPTDVINKIAAMSPKGVSWFGPGWQQRTRQFPFHPSPQWGGEENGKKKAKLLDQDKYSLTEWQRKKTVMTIIPLRRISKTREYTGQLSRLMLSVLLSNGYPPGPWPTLPLSTQHDVTWYRIPCLFGQFGSAVRLCRLLASCEN